MIDIPPPLPPPLSLVAQRVLDFLACLAAAAAEARSPCFLRSAEEKEEEKEGKNDLWEFISDSLCHCSFWHFW